MAIDSAVDADQESYFMGSATPSCDSYWIL